MSRAARPTSNNIMKISIFYQYLSKFPIKDHILNITINVLHYNLLYRKFDIMLLVEVVVIMWDDIPPPDVFLLSFLQLLSPYIRVFLPVCNPYYFWDEYVKFKGRYTFVITDSFA